MGIKERGMPKIVIVDEHEINSRGAYVGGYQAQSNVLFISNTYFNKKRVYTNAKGYRRNLS